MINKIEKLLDLCIAVAEKYLEAKPGGQMGLPLGEQARSTEAALPAENAVEEPKKTRKPRASAKEAATVGGTSTPEMKAEHEAELNGEGTDGLEDQLGIEEPAAPKQAEMTEKESRARMEEVTKQYVSLCKNDTPEDGKTRAIKLMKETFKVAKLGDLTHEDRMKWIKHMEAGIVAHK